MIVAAGGTLNGVIWLDLNENGLQDKGEPGLPGVSVSAEPDVVAPAGFNGVTTAAVYSASTDKKGRYSFKVAPGDYVISAILSSSYLYESFAKDPKTKKLLTSESWTFKVKVASNENKSANFAAAGNGEVQGNVFFTSGAIVAGATVECLWSGFDGILGTEDDVVITTKADANGGFALKGIPGGQYSCTGIDPKTGGRSPKIVTVVGTSKKGEKPAPSVVQLPIAPKGTHFFVFVVSNFIPGSPVLTKAIRSKIIYYSKKYKRAKKVLVEGYTMGKTLLKVDYQLSLNRAKNAYILIKTINKKIKLVKLKNYQDYKHFGNKYRRVRVTFTW